MNILHDHLRAPEVFVFGFQLCRKFLVAFVLLDQVREKINLLFQRPDDPAVLL